MRTAILFITFALLASCSKPDHPEFRKVTNVQIKEVSLKNINITADAVYYNPNDIGLKIVKSDIEVLANEVSVGKIDVRDMKKIEPNAEFKVPLDVNFPPEKLLQDEKGLLGGIFSGFLEKKIDLFYQGTITMSVAAIKFNVPVEFEETIDLKKK